MNKLLAIGTMVSLGLVGCGDDTGGTALDSAVVIDASTPDSNPVDAAPPAIDAFVPCFGQALFTGEYVDWDSTVMMFRGVAEATVVEVGNASNTVMTAPNGRVILCLTPGSDADVGYTHASYLPMTFSAHADVMGLGAGFSTRGLKPARATQLATDLGVAAFTGTQVLVEVRNFNTAAPVSGVTLALAGNTVEKTFALDDAGQWIASADSDTTATAAAGYVLFTNVVGAGSATLTITAGAGMTCTGRSAVTLVPNGIAATSVHCQ